MENHGAIRREDVEMMTHPSGDSWTVILIHEPTSTRVQVTDLTVMLASSRAWMRLRDKLEGLC